MADQNNQKPAQQASAPAQSGDLAARVEKLERINVELVQTVSTLRDEVAGLIQKSSINAIPSRNPKTILM
jgi:hypothetical protein